MRLAVGSRVEKDVSQETIDMMPFLGYSYCARYNEYTLISENKLRRIVVTVK